MEEFHPPPGTTYAGVDVGGTKLLVVIYSTEGRRTHTFPTGPHATPADLASHLATLPLPPTTIWGLALPGLISKNGTVQDCDVLPQLTHWNPAETWPHHPPAAVLNDGEAALVQAAAGSPPQATIAAIGCGTGLVAAIQAAGQRLRYHRPFAGELGLAPYGNTGTFDDHASGAALLRRLHRTPDEIRQALAQSDPAATAAIHHAGEAFGAAVATVLHLLHPEKIALYGGTLRYAGYLDAALAHLQRISHPALLAQCQVEHMPEPELAVAHGALRAALQA